jgi:uncharacterized protein
MAHPNEDLVRRGYEAFAKGDMDTLRELFDPEIVWHFPGRSVLAGDHRGTDAVLGFFGKTIELTAGTFQVEVHDVVADDRHTVGLHLATGEREGRTLLEDREVLVFHIRDGKVVEVAVPREPVHLRRVLLLAAAAGPRPLLGPLIRKSTTNSQAAAPGAAQRSRVQAVDGVGVRQPVGG